MRCSCRTWSVVRNCASSTSTHDTFAASSLGLLYQRGQGVKQDYAQAIEWYRKAADKGDVAASLNLAPLYAKGLGVKQDLAAAAGAPHEGEDDEPRYPGTCRPLPVLAGLPGAAYAAARPELRQVRSSSSG